MSCIQLIEYLADGEHHSGEELGKHLGISRTAVWKQLQKAEEEFGLSIEKKRGLGYRLEGGCDLLNKNAIQESLQGAAKALPLQLFSEIDSSNSELLRQAASGSPGNIICAAEFQNAGRGRMGRQWISPYGRNLYFSVLWEFHGGAAALEGLSLCVGVAIARALHSIGLDGLQLKWPNDVLLNGKKLAGILLEMQGDADGNCHVVIGIGLNVDMRGCDTSGITQAWADLHSTLPSKPDRSKLLSLLCNHLADVILDFEKYGFSHFKDDWQQLDAFNNKKVEIILGKNHILGTAIGINDGGALKLETTEGIKEFHGGEISLRSAQL